MLDTKELLSYMSDCWNIYASGKSYDGERLRLKFSACGGFRVTKGDEMVYDGTSIEEAVECFNDNAQ